MLSKDLSCCLGDQRKVAKYHEKQKQQTVCDCLYMKSVLNGMFGISRNTNFKN